MPYTNRKREWGQLEMYEDSTGQPMWCIHHDRPWPTAGRTQRGD